MRRLLFNQKIGAKAWLDIHRTAHELGLRSNASMLYGHIESVEHRVEPAGTGLTGSAEEKIEPAVQARGGFERPGAGGSVMRRTGEFRGRRKIGDGGDLPRGPLRHNLEPVLVERIE